MSNLSYEIESLFIEGMDDEEIAETLQITVEEVEAWMLANGLAEEPYSPHVTINS
jgi:DNA-binding CsgD family transcriptional regulator